MGVNYTKNSRKGEWRREYAIIHRNAKDEEELQREFERLKEFSRDHSRTVMQWNKTKNAGFSAGTPWTYVNSNYKTVNVEKSIKDKDSILNNYSKLLAVRNEYGADLITAKYKFYRKKGVVGYKVKTPTYELDVVANISREVKPIKLDNAKLLYSNFALENGLKPYQFAILKRSK